VHLPQLPFSFAKFLNSIGIVEDEDDEDVASFVPEEEIIVVTNETIFCTNSRNFFCMPSRKVAVPLVLVLVLVVVVDDDDGDGDTEETINANNQTRIIYFKERFIILLLDEDEEKSDNKPDTNDGDDFRDAAAAFDINMG